tara:strand:+ start:422 stop:772 length:351 start_codon:yes stop_codon:yes gene_type:complete
MAKLDAFLHLDAATGSLYIHYDGAKYEDYSGSGLDTELGIFSSFVSSSVYTGQYSASDGWSDANKRKLAEWCSETDLVSWTNKNNLRGVSPPAVPRYQTSHTASIWLESWDNNDNV